MDEFLCGRKGRGVPVKLSQLQTQRKVDGGGGSEFVLSDGGGDGRIELLRHHLRWEGRGRGVGGQLKAQRIRGGDSWILSTLH